MSVYKFLFCELMMFVIVLPNLACSRVSSSKNGPATEPTLGVVRENAVTTDRNKNKDPAAMHANGMLKRVSSTQNRLENDEELQRRKTMYMDTLEAIDQFEISHKKEYEYTLKERGSSATAEYDKSKVEELRNKAKVLADQQQFHKAREQLKQAEHIIISAIQKMMDKQTVVNKLKLDTPLDEYIYELRRYESYHELIPIALEKLRPPEHVKEQMDKYVKKGEFQKQAAVAKAKEGDLPVAIAMLLSATKNIRLALKTAGIPQWDSLEDAAGFE